MVVYRSLLRGLFAFYDPIVMATSLCVLYLALIVAAFQSAFAIKHRNTYYKYYIEDSCTDDENITYVLSLRGIYSVARIVAFRPGGLHFRAKHCTITIKPPVGYSVHLLVESFRFGYSYDNSVECASYIQISGNGTVSDKLCGPLSALPSTSFTTEGNMTILFHTTSNYLLLGSGFTLVATAYRTSRPCIGYNRFSCDNGRCIWQGLTCDFVDNCGDSSDEASFGNSQCFDADEFTVKPLDFWEIPYPTSEIVTFSSAHNISLGAAIASAVFVILGAVIRFYCYYQCHEARRRRVLSAVTIIRSRSVMRQPSVNNAPPPPYETLVNDSESHQESPPAYATVTAPQTEPCSAQNSTTTDLPAPGKDTNATCDPPPPYEP